MEIIKTKYWEEAWQKARDNSPWKNRRTLEEVLNFWEKKATNYSQDVLGNKGEKRVKRVLSFLEKENVQLDGKEVLDIGAGPGAFALPLSKKAKNVVAIEPVPGMVRILKENMRKEGRKNIQILEMAWEEIDLEKEGFSSSFDLVFASMSPGIKSRSMMEKALKATREYAFFSGYAGIRENKALQELWPLLFPDEYPSWPGDVFYLMNLLYTKKLSFSCQVYEDRGEERLSVEEAIKKINTSLQEIGRDGEGKEEIIHKYVKENAKEGIFIHSTYSRKGMMIVKMAKVLHKI